MPPPPLCELLAAVDLPMSALTQEYDSSWHPRLSRQQRVQVELHWRHLKGSGRRLTNGVLYRFRSLQREGGGLRLRTGRTCYKEYLALNLAHPEWRQSCGVDCTADPIAVTGVVVTRDGRVPMQRRSATVGEWSGAYAVSPCGHPQPPHSVQEALMAELQEETGIRPEEVLGEPRLTGVLMEVVRHKVELTFLLRTSLTWEGLLSRTPSDAWEYDALDPLEWTPDACAAFVSDKERTIVPQSRGALMLAGRLEFGEDWYIGLAGRLTWGMGR